MVISKKSVMRLMVMFIVLTMVFATVGVSNASYAASKPTKMTLKVSSKTIDINGKATVAVKSVSPKGASKAVTFKSSNTKVATVNKKGVVVGKKKGTVTITVTSTKNKKLKKSVKITVKDLKATSITLDRDSLKTVKGWNKTLKATVKGPAGYYNPGVVWKSSDSSVASVSSKGEITANAAGTATITATVKGESKKASMEVTVLDSVQAGDTGVDFGKFKWNVLDVQDGKALLLTENVVEYRPYNKESKSITWAASTIREYLNDQFITNTFSPAESARILETELENNDNAWYESEGGEDTIDQVFLLSAEEVLKYFGDSGMYAQGDPDVTIYFVSDEYDEARKAVFEGAPEEGPTWWFLRTPGFKNGRAAEVSEYGWLLMYGDCVIADWGIRPAVWVSLE